MPGPIGNTNNLKHGLLTGSMPKGCTYLKKALGRFRVELEAAVTERRGEVDLYAASLVSSAVHWHRHALLANRWLAKEVTLTIDQRVTLSREVARACDQRDKCLKLLGLDRDGSDDVLLQLYGPVVTSDEPDAEPDGASCEADATESPNSTSEPSETPDAAGATPGALNANPVVDGCEHMLSSTPSSTNDQQQVIP
jgi:hypothetical protein